MQISTLLLPAGDDSAWVDSIVRASEILRRGGLVAFPTETVYGLGADARSSEAVRRIFVAKGRPSCNPLIVHCADAAEASRWTTRWDRRAELLAQAFWPGPLTLVLPCGPGIAPEVTAGGATVGLRVPAHPVALALLREAAIPIAAPSANRSNAISPTSAAAVEQSLGGRIDAILNGGSCPVGIESTVLDLSEEVPRILRPGMVTAGDIGGVLGVSVSDAAPAGAGSPLRSPGQLPRHYAPSIPLLILDELPDSAGDDAFLIRFGPAFSQESRCITLTGDPSEYAARLYWALHLAESSGASRVLLECPPDGDRWRAIHDRIHRAASH